MRVGAANKPLSEWVEPRLLLECEPVFQDVSHHIASVEIGDVDGESTI